MWAEILLRPILRNISLHRNTKCFLSYFAKEDLFARDSCKKWQENINKLGPISQSKQLLLRFIVNKNTILDWKTKTTFFSIKDPQQLIHKGVCDQCLFLKSMVRKRAFLGCVSQVEGSIIHIVDLKKRGIFTFKYIFN